MGWIATITMSDHFSSNRFGIGIGLGLTPSVISFNDGIKYDLALLFRFGLPNLIYAIHIDSDHDFQYDFSFVDMSIMSNNLGYLSIDYTHRNSLFILISQGDSRT